MAGCTDNGFDKDPERARQAGKKSRRGLSAKATLEKMLEAEAPEKFIEQIKEAYPDIDAKKIHDLLQFKLITEGLKGDIRAIKEINDRVDGRATQTINASVDHKIERAHDADIEKWRHDNGLMTDDEKMVYENEIKSCD